MIVIGDSYSNMVRVAEEIAKIGSDRSNNCVVELTERYD